MPWYFAVVERHHQLQNPTSVEKIRLLGEWLGLGPQTHVLDVASGKGGPAIVLAGEFGCRITCVERSPEFAAAARDRVRDAGLDDRIELVQADASAFPLQPEHYDAALCLGASFVWDGLIGTLAALTPAVRANGSIAVGEPYWRTGPAAELDVGGDHVTIAETVERFRTAGLTPVALVDSSLDDWDRYESQHWFAAEEWLAANPHDPDAAAIREQHEQTRDRYLGGQREALGWAIFVARKA